MPSDTLSFEHSHPVRYQPDLLRPGNDISCNAVPELLQEKDPSQKDLWIHWIRFSPILRWMEACCDRVHLLRVGGLHELKQAVAQVGGDTHQDLSIQALQDIHQAEARQERLTTSDIEVLRLEPIPYLEPLLPGKEWLWLELSAALEPAPPSSTYT